LRHVALFLGEMPFLLVSAPFGMCFICFLPLSAPFCAFLRLSAYKGGTNMQTRRKIIGKSLFTITKEGAFYYVVERNTEATFYSKPFKSADEAIAELQKADRDSFFAERGGTKAR
jgi:hypothetical protein